MAKDLPVVTVTPPKSGFLSSEFFLHALVSISGMLLAFLPNNPYVQGLGAVAAVITSGHYAIHRGKIKAMAYNVALAAYSAALKVYISTDEDGNPLQGNQVPNLSSPSVSSQTAGASLTPSAPSSEIPSAQQGT